MNEKGRHCAAHLKPKAPPVPVDDGHVLPVLALDFEGPPPKAPVIDLTELTIPAVEEAHR